MPFGAGLAFCAHGVTAMRDLATKPRATVATRRPGQAAHDRGSGSPVCFVTIDGICADLAWPSLSVTGTWWNAVPQGPD